MPIPLTSAIHIDVFTTPLMSDLEPKIYEIFTPFNPKFGYTTIDDSDFDLELSLDKTKEYLDKRKEHLDIIHHLRAPLKLNVSAISLDRNPSTGLWEFVPNSYLEKLRLSLFFPTGIAVVVEPKASESIPNAVVFDEFRLLDTPDTPPLATPRSPSEQKDFGSLRPELILAVPHNKKELEKIVARFILLPNQAET